MNKMRSTYAVLALVTCLLVPLSLNALGHEEMGLQDGEHPQEPAPSRTLLLRPQPGYLYVHDREVTHLGGRITVIIGGITIKAHDRRDPLFDKVDFVIDRRLKHSDDRPPFQWNWNEQTIGWHTITLTGYVGERFITESLSPFVYNIQTR